MLLPLFTAFSILFTFQGQAYERFKPENLSKGQCVSDPDAKLYLAGLKASTQPSYDRIKKEIGLERLQTLQDTDTSNHYFCQITCRSGGSALEKIWIGLSESPARFADMNGFLCPAVQIETVQIVGSIYGPQPVNTPFYAFDVSYPEVHQWLKKVSFHFPQEDLEKKRSQLKITLNKLAAAYISSGLPTLRQAGVQLSEIAAGSEVGQAILRDRLAELEVTNWKIETDYTSVNFYVMTALKTNGRFLAYTDL